MRLTLVRNLALTRAVCGKKKPKADTIVVMCESVTGTHRRNELRPRLGEKLEFMAFDPMIQKEVLYKEKKKVRSVRD